MRACFTFVFAESKIRGSNLRNIIDFSRVHATWQLEIDQFTNQRFLLTPGGGGRRGIAPLPLEDAVVEVRRLLSFTGLAWPGIEIEKVCPSLRL